jgi:hypothetical protein
VVQKKGSESWISGISAYRLLDLSMVREKERKGHGLFFFRGLAGTGQLPARYVGMDGCNSTPSFSFA